MTTPSLGKWPTRTSTGTRLSQPSRRMSASSLVEHQLHLRRLAAGGHHCDALGAFRGVTALLFALVDEIKAPLLEERGSEAVQVEDVLGDQQHQPLGYRVLDAVLEASRCAEQSAEHRVGHGLGDGVVRRELDAAAGQAPRGPHDGSETGASPAVHVHVVPPHVRRPHGERLQDAVHGSQALFKQRHLDAWVKGLIAGLPDEEQDLGAKRQRQTEPILLNVLGRDQRIERRRQLVALEGRRRGHLPNDRTGGLEAPRALRASRPRRCCYGGAAQQQ
eukprot:scaffold1245_cov252-Pinguiococcus_pyrenoidosus.AAC.24